MTRSLTIYGGNIVTPDGIIGKGTVVLEGGRIAEVREGIHPSGRPNDIDASGRWLLPGMIDTHSDAIEHEMQPRPTSRFPVSFSYYELERKLAGQGVTTIYHSLSMWGENAEKDLRKNEQVKEIIQSIARLRKEEHLIHHRLHIRVEITNESVVPYVEAFIREGQADQMSFMDHTPGQGQYRDSAIHKQFIMRRQNKTEDEADKLLEERKHRRRIAPEELRRLADLAYEYGIPVASHDDDSVGKLAEVASWRAAISEFPVDLEVAVEAKRRGLHVVMGAPNVILGRSHSGNLSALEAIDAGVVDILCSDYYPPAMIRAVFLLYHRGLPLSEAVRMVSLNPAKALGIADRTGSLEAGKEADLLIVKEHQMSPVIEKVVVRGQVVCQMDYLNGLTAESVQGAEPVEA